MVSRPDWLNYVTLTRRQVLHLMAIATATAVFRPRLPVAVAGTTPGASLSTGGFLDANELAILDAATARILPSDDRPGAREIGVVDYIQSMLSFMPGSDANCDRHVTAADVTAIEVKAFGQSDSCPHGGDVNGDGMVDSADVAAGVSAVFRARPVFAGGPFSGRHPQAHFPIGTTACQTCHGATGLPAGGSTGAESVEVFPPNSFREFLPLTRLQTMSWKVRIFGAETVSEVAGNPLAAERPEVDLRRKYRQGLASLDALSLQDPQFGVPFVELPPESQTEVLDRVEVSFNLLLHRHVIEGTLCAPEYGGNRNLLGWQLTRFDGDSQPLGYAIRDESVPGNYREREDKPNSGPNPDEDCDEFSEPMNKFLSLLSIATGGGKFANPYCFGVDS